MRRALLGLAGWLLVAAAATVAGILAVSLVDSGVTGSAARPLSSEGVRHALEQASQRSPTPTATRPATSRSPATPSVSPTKPTRPATAPEGVTKVIHSAGGTIVARCTGATAYLVSWSPKQGFEIDDDVRGPAKSTYVKFESDDVKVHVTVGCRGGVPDAQIVPQYDRDDD